MWSVYQLKPAFQMLLRPVLTVLVRAGVSPNQVTWAALGVSLGGGLMLMCVTAPWVLLWMPFLLLVRMALNALDGMLARQQEQSTPAGEILNELGDVLSDMALYLPLVVWVRSDGAAMAVVAFVMASVLSEFCGVLGKVVSGQRRYDGPMGKSDRALAVSLVAVGLYAWLDAPDVFWTGLFAVLTGLVTLSAALRVRRALMNVGAPDHG